MGETFACGIQNPGLWNPEYSIRNPESHLTIGIQNPSSTDNNWNPVLYSGIHGVGSRIQDCLRFSIHGTRKSIDNDHIETGNC